MKLMVTLALSCLAAASPQPELQYDPDTISTCIEWFNNDGSDTCESIRSMFGISPADFHKWNPSVGTDCKPWRYQSYCVLTKERLASLTSTTTKASSTTSTSSSSHVPSPPSWTALGCYTDDDAKFPVLEKQVSSDDKSLQIKSCETKCWQASTSRNILYAGVKQGNQCWCGSFVGGQTSKNQSDCNTPCSGNAKEMCGGKERINVFQPVTTTVKPATTTLKGSATTTEKSSVSSTTKGSVSTTTTRASGAVKNRGIF